MKCKGCKWQSKGSDDVGLYCIAAPDFETPEEIKHIIKAERIIKYGPNEAESNYRASDDDECHSWLSERFEQ